MTGDRQGIVGEVGEVGDRQDVVAGTGDRRDLVAEVGERLGVRVLRTLGRGGSGAYSVLTECGPGGPAGLDGPGGPAGLDGTGGLAVLKIAVARPNVADGHDLESFRRKARQVEQLRRTVPALARHYPPVLAVLDGPDWSATLTRYAPGLDLVDLGARHGAELAHRTLRAVWSRLCADGYAATSVPAPAGHGVRDFCDRLERRRHLLAGSVPPVLLDAGSVCVNGRTVPGFDGAAATARALAGVFDGAPVAAPVHGDLNLRNIVVDPDSGGFALLDPRGTLARWSPVYDLAKVLFTLTLFDDLMTGGAVVTRRSDGEFTVALRAPRHRAWCARLVADLYEMLAEAGVAGPLAVSRLLLAHATHVLAESACRISDVGQPAPVRRQNALALLLFGLLLAADLVEQPADLAEQPAARSAGHQPSVGRHLALLDACPDPA